MNTVIWSTGWFQECKSSLTNAIEDSLLVSVITNIYSTRWSTLCTTT